MTLKTRSLWLWDVSLLLSPLSLRCCLPIYGIIAVVATGVMIPRLRATNFGLLDDGVTIAVAEHLLQEFRRGNWGVLFSLESERGRFKPLNIFYYTIPYLISGPSAFGFFVVQWLSLVFTGIVLYKAVEVATKDRMSGVLSSIFYMISPPVIENYYTLSKSEPPMVLWLALSLFFLWKAADPLLPNRKYVYFLLTASSYFMSIAYFTKETAHAMLLVSTLWAVSALCLRRGSQSHRLCEVKYKYFIINVIITGIYWWCRMISGTVNISSGSDSGNYQFMLEVLCDSLLKHVGWYVRDFSYLLPTLLFLTALMSTLQKNRLSSRNLIVLDGILWIAGWTAIMLPWHSTLEYRLLPATLGVAVIAGTGVSAVVERLWDPSKAVRRFARITLLCVLVTASISLANGFTNGRVQVVVDSANTDLIDYLALNVPLNGTLLVNLPEPNEYVFEMELHLAILKQRPDIRVRYFDSLNLTTDLGAFIVTPIMQNQLYPSVRIAVHEDGAKIWESELHAMLGERAALVYQKVKTVPLFTVAVEKVICPWLIRSNVQDGVYCGVKRPAIDRRVFRYGWEVYRI